MDDEFQELERELRRLRPAQLRPQLAARVDHEIGASAKRLPRALRWFLPLAAAAGILVASRLERISPADSATVKPVVPIATASAASAFKPVAAENLLINARDEGVVIMADGTPARQVRASFVDTIVWRNAATNASLTWTVPREEVRVVPISYQ